MTYPRYALLCISLALGCGSDHAGTAPDSGTADTGCERVLSFFHPGDPDVGRAVRVSEEAVCDHIGECFASVAEAEAYGRDHAVVLRDERDEIVGCSYEVVRGCGVTSVEHGPARPLLMWSFSDASGELIGAARWDDAGHDVGGCNALEFVWGMSRPECPDETRTSLCEDADVGTP